MIFIVLLCSFIIALDWCVCLVVFGIWMAVLIVRVYLVNVLFIKVPLV